MEYNFIDSDSNKNNNNGKPNTSNLTSPSFCDSDKEANFSLKNFLFQMQHLKS